MKENGVFTCMGINVMPQPKGDPTVSVNLVSANGHRMTMTLLASENPYALFKKYHFLHGEEVTE